MMNKGTESDEGLMLRVVRGQRECLSPLIRRHASGLLTYIQRMIGDRHRSEELFQEVFLAVWSKRGQYKFPRPFRAWLFGIATNRCRSEFRKARPETYSFADGQPLLAIAADPSPLDTAIATETSAIVAHAVASLPPKQAQRHCLASLEQPFLCGDWPRPAVFGNDRSIAHASRLGRRPTISGTPFVTCCRPNQEMDFCTG